MELSIDRTHGWRAARALLIGVIIEGALVYLANRAPAMASLIRPLYWVLGAIFLYGAFNALRTRSGTDRRRGDRRDEADAQADVGDGEERDDRAAR